MSGSRPNTTQSATFEVVDHDIPLKKIRTLRFGNSSKEWYESYLGNRSQQVLIDGTLSNSLNLEAGVPQGSILGPLLYVIFTSDLPEFIHSRDAHDAINDNHNNTHPSPLCIEDNVKYHLHCQTCGGLCCYADDSTYTKTDKNPIVLKNKIDEAYKKVESYMTNNKLILNSDKTHLLVMTSARNHKIHDNYGITLNTGAEIIKPQNYEKLLGGFISNNLTWKENIRDNKKSLFRIITSRINALSKISRISSFKTRKMIANGIVMSKIIYLIQLWGSSPKYLIDFLQKLQNKAARLVTKKNVYTPVNELLNQCGWLSIRQLVVYHNVLQVYKTKHTKKPAYLYQKFTQNFGANTRLAKSNAIRMDSKIKSELGLNNFTYVTSQQWNDLPIDLKQSPKLSDFKNNAKKWIKENIAI